ncbi:MAG TPA: leucyl/phenylalanyl-tRNA--protein transferase [Pyrinomonadaceae bacterium]|jgi:leucyl/phenylalanyl-tRNA--protein transferase|nr:leucyl/phenylalanyl-tRNA--protein transferase [Pyrinomonadaceae bacterium]HQX54855.1 leucyl/phenylalanyl-tRNA--protein transferase [Pyrinomonadaceae bacterium]HQY65715.1 leucyl/phenylalanyl-tRNA--protein transferase [Pyrinomonadaceae bacterium]HRA40411.1 leucyl/phenylalanyl-tRNA--protein transferase [Pyrinomonadaceae bacterium]
MSQIDFPDPLTYDYPSWMIIGQFMYPAGGIVHFGGRLTAENVVRAYRMGIFPWYTEGIPLPWHCPDLRAIIEFDELRISRSLAKIRRGSELRFTIDQDFPAVIRECKRAFRPGQQGTWITPDFVRVYTELHLAGIAHSVEAWDAEDNLVGGLYGIDAGGVFCGESMFYKSPNASKLALLHLIDHLSDRGSNWLDAQVMTPHMQALGAIDIDREDFLDKLKATQLQNLTIF